MKVVVVVPTYNERENIGRLLEELCALPLEDLHVVVVDDASPDGTGEAVQAVGRGRGGVELLGRGGGAERGRGLAGRAGFLRALELGADRIVEMDADFSHDPRRVPDLLAALDRGADVALGSRFVPGGAERNRGLVRRTITRLANWYIRIVFGIPVLDSNSGFRAFRREALAGIEPDSLTSKGPAIVQEVLFRATRRGYRIVEVPILFVNRERGRSKLGIAQLLQGYFAVLRLRGGELLRGRRP
jgi:glycosyltransferase involved in cell wall biosynthesis